MLSKLEMDGTFLDPIKSVYGEKSTVIVPLNGEKLTALSLRPGILRQECPFPHFVILGVLCNVIKEENEMAGQWIEEIKLSLCADDRILYRENPKESTKKRANPRLNEFSKVSGHEINTQKSVAFLCTNNKQLGTE